MDRVVRTLKVALVVATVGIFIALFVQVRRKRRIAIDVAGEIEERLADLDPVTRAAVVARVSTDTVRAVRDSRSDRQQ